MKKIAVMAVMCAVLCTSCHNTSSGNSEEGEHHHHESMLITSYGEDYELFAEISPLAVGQESSIAAHFTRLSDFKPADDQQITGVFNVGGEQTLSGQCEGGIAKFSITPQSAGDGTISFTIDGQTLSAPIKVYATDDEADEAAEAAEVSSSNGVSFTKEKSWKVDFSTEEAKSEPFGQVIRAAGQVMPTQSLERTIVARASGIVKFQGSLLPGSAVSAGRSLMTISGEGMADGNISSRYAQAKAEYDNASAQYERKKSLEGTNIVSAAELDEAKARYESAKAAYENISKGYNGGSLAVFSDISGYITEVMVTSGQYVEAGQPLASVSSSGTVLIQARVQPRYRRALESVCDAVFKVYDDTYTLKDLGGHIVSVARAASSDNPMLPVTFEVSNRAGFVQGTFVDVYIKTLTNSSAVTVPTEAVIEEMGNWFVYKQLTPEFFEKTQVTVGATDGIRTEITSGLEAGERIVARGAILVKLAQAAGGLDAHAGHVH